MGCFSRKAHGMTWTFQLNSAWISNGPSCPKNQDIVCFRIFRQISPERQKQILPRHLPGKDILLTSAAGIIHSRQRRLMDSKRRNTPRIVCTPSPPGAYDRAGDRARLSSRRPLGQRRGNRRNREPVPPKRKFIGADKAGVWVNSGTDTRGRMQGGRGCGRRE